MLVVADTEVNAPNTDHPPNKKCLGHQPKRLNFLAPRPARTRDLGYVPMRRFGMDLSEMPQATKAHATSDTTRVP